jgi:hypothetical protein
MEPLIPDGSLCVFRRGGFGMVVGPRSGRLVLVNDTTATGDEQFTVKRYKSEKAETEEGWHHTRIWLEPLNPDSARYRSLVLQPEEEKYRILAEFVRVLD